MLSSAVALEEPILHANRWTLEREAGDEWCSLISTPAGWTLSMHGGEFTVVAEGDEPGGTAIELLHARLRAQGWRERPVVDLRPKADRRRRPPWRVSADRGPAVSPVAASAARR